MQDIKKQLEELKELLKTPFLDEVTKLEIEKAINLVDGIDFDEDNITNTPSNQYKVDVSKIKTLEDIKIILELMDLHITLPEDGLKFDMVKHLIKKV